MQFQDGFAVPHSFAVPMDVSAFPFFDPNPSSISVSTPDLVYGGRKRKRPVFLSPDDVDVNVDEPIQPKRRQLLGSRESSRPFSFPDFAPIFGPASPLPRPPSQTCVIHVSPEEFSTWDYFFDVYIGPEIPDPVSGRHFFSESKWANPFSIPDPQRNLHEYCRYVLQKPLLFRSLRDLKGLRLGCACAAYQWCHGHTLVALVERFCREDPIPVGPPNRPAFSSSACDRGTHGVDGDGDAVLVDDDDLAPDSRFAQFESEDEEEGEF